MYLIYDTETSTFPSKALAANDPKQARVVQIAAVLLDENFKEVDRLYEILQPPFEGFEIAEGAFKAHGITVERMIKEGRDRREVFNTFFSMAMVSQYLIAHNQSFDSNMIDIENCCFLQDENRYALLPIKRICTMELSTPLCKLPFASKQTFGKKYKWPKLEEALRILCNHTLEGAHDSLNDVLGTAKLFEYLVKNGYVELIKLPVGTLPA